MTTEYRVMEIADNGFHWKHGYQGTNKTEAYANLHQMRKSYGKYGRKFVMETRQVSDWTGDNES